MDRAVVGISGGVDSAVTAGMLKETGFDVTCIFLKMHDFSENEKKDAQRICDILNLPFVEIDLRAEFKSIIVSDFIDNYSCGRTPNPCIICNPLLKFKALNDYAYKHDISRIATGHYAGIGETNGRYYIKKSDSVKDQSYMLYRLTQQQLKNIVFPLYGMDKEKIRDIAKKTGLPVYDKKDSQEICFIKGDYREYLKKAVSGISDNGDFVLIQTGQVLGRHTGITDYTIGQRKGLGVSHKSPLYVAKIDVSNNIVYLSEEDVTNIKEIHVSNAVFQKIAGIDKELHAQVKIRYSSKTADAVITPEDNGLYKIEFNTPQRAATPGQSAVFYDNDDVIGGGIIVN